MGAGPGRQTNDCTIEGCVNLTTVVDSPFSPPLSEQGPSNGRYDFAGPNYIEYTAPNISHIQGISRRIATRCGEPNAAEYGD